MKTQRTRIVCVSDTHNQTPQLPPGDILIHAGDLTNQGSYSELKKTVEWIEKSPFQAKIVIAGNHDTTLDKPFFYSNSNKWKWPQPQDPVACKKLVTESTSITYLENEAATIYLTSPNGPKTRFKVFGSPYSPGRRGWAFQYEYDVAALKLWDEIENDVDIVVTHTPACGHRDSHPNTPDFRAGCPVLMERLAKVRPMMHVCGHIHQGRGAERMRWRTSSSESGKDTDAGSVESIQVWQDPGQGNKKLSLLDISARSRDKLDYTGYAGASEETQWLRSRLNEISMSEGSTMLHADVFPESSFDEDFKAEWQNDEEKTWLMKDGGATECRGAQGRTSEIHEMVADPTGNPPSSERKETVMVNAAILGPRVAGKALLLNKPIVIDVELPVWDD